MSPAMKTTVDARRLRGLLWELGRGAGASRFDVAPNPCVGAAVLTGECEVARGFHTVWGQQHAELAALGAAAESAVPEADWDTLVVTLEPCSTHGKTPACTDAILASGIQRVVVGCLDPDARHRGRGLELLRDAGLEVEYLHSASPLQQVAPHFLEWAGPDRTRRPRPWTIAKWAQTRTGQLVPPADIGEGRWISSAEARDEVQVLRARVDAIVTGVGTVLADDPRLSVRPPAVLGAAGPPLRVVLDGMLRTLPGARLFATAADMSTGEVAGPVLIITQRGASPERRRALEAVGAEIAQVHADSSGRLVLREVQELLWKRGVRRSLLEAGPVLQAAFLEEGLSDQLRVYTGDVNGGRGASLAEWLQPHQLGEREDRECGSDSVLEAFVVGGA